MVYYFNFETSFNLKQLMWMLMLCILFWDISKFSLIFKFKSHKLTNFSSFLLYPYLFYETFKERTNRHLINQLIKIW